MSKKYVQVTLAEVEAVLEPLGFQVIRIDGCKEVVFAKRVDIHGHPLSLRVFTSITGTTSRDCGKDAMRVCLAFRDGDKIKTIGSSKRINRVAGWNDRLLERVSGWESQLGPWCDRCGKPMIERKGKNGKFYGCCGYPDCRYTVNKKGE